MLHAHKTCKDYKVITYAQNTTIIIQINVIL